VIGDQWGELMSHTVTSGDESVRARGPGLGRTNAATRLRQFQLRESYGVGGTELFLNTKAATKPTHKKPMIWVNM
jgi:hypothetical protein